MINEYKNHSKYLITAILTLPLLMGIYALLFFETAPSKKQLDLAQDSKVAGASDKISVEDITNIIPIIPGAEISSITNSNGDITLIMESKDAEIQTKSFYEDFFFKNNWQQVDKNSYQKGLKTINLEIADNIIKAQIKDIE